MLNCEANIGWFVHTNISTFIHNIHEHFSHFGDGEILPPPSIFHICTLSAEHQNFDTKNVKHIVTIKKGSKIVDMIRLDMPKVLFLSTEIEDPVTISTSISKIHFLAPPKLRVYSRR